ncbi:MAG: hypothetical protein EG823_09375 [Actinobacteria bacterium]|nr:hypothetical protein [Actinomycetota bacterium]
MVAGPKPKVATPARTPASSRKSAKPAVATRKPRSTPTSGDAAALTKALEDFVAVRGRPALFLVLNESLFGGHVLEVRRCLAGKDYPEMDLVIFSNGGNINAAYQILELCHVHSQKVNACVPLYAKSAATLLCLGADTIVLEEISELGPLDTQVGEEIKTGRVEYHSALNPFKALEQLQDFALETLDKVMKMLLLRSGMDLNECLSHANEFVSVTAGPLVNQLNAERLGEYNRALQVGLEYGVRVLTRHGGWDLQEAKELMERLVYGYPSHDYIIDHHELVELGLNVELFTPDEQAASTALIEMGIRQNRLIRCVEPTAQP